MLLLRQAEANDLQAMFAIYNEIIEKLILMNK